jgi:hypothetical protein
MITTISFAVGIVSIALAIIAMFSSKATEKRSQENFEKTQSMMHDIYDKTKDALAQIDKKAEIIDAVVQRNQEQLIKTMTNILNETVIPKKPDMGEEIGTQFLANILKNPADATENIKTLMALAGEIEKYTKKDSV